MSNLILKDFNYSKNVIKIILPAGKASKTPLLINIFNEYNFNNFDDFFSKFNNCTSFLPKDTYLLVLLYIPDIYSSLNFYSFYIKSPSSIFLLKKILYKKILINSSLISLDIIDLFKISLIKSLFLSNSFFFKFNFYFKYIKSNFLSLKGLLRSIQVLYYNNEIFYLKHFKLKF